jgi:predicted ATP-dependent serine protease
MNDYTDDDEFTQDDFIIDEKTSIANTDDLDNQDEQNKLDVQTIQSAVRCSNCGLDRLISSGKRPPINCPSCFAINTFKAIPIEKACIRDTSNRMQSNNSINHGLFERLNGISAFGSDNKRFKVKITDPSNHKRQIIQRSTTGVLGLDHVIGGGLIFGYMLMVAGPPGAGKSTICTQAISYIQKHGMHYGYGGAYGSSEEDDDSIIETAERVADANFKIARSKSVHDLIGALDTINAKTWVVDSLMELINEQLPGEPGSPSQVNSCISILYDRAKAEGRYKGLEKRTILIIAHGTKGGDMAGPLKALHGVDGAILMEHLNPQGDEKNGILPWSPSIDQTRPTGYVGARVFRKMRKTSNKREAYFQMQSEYTDPINKIINPFGGRLDTIQGPDWNDLKVKKD